MLKPSRQHLSHLECPNVFETATDLFLYPNVKRKVLNALINTMEHVSNLCWSPSPSSYNILPRCPSTLTNMFSEIK